MSDEPSEDAALFADAAMAKLAGAAEDLRYLLGRGYPTRSALTLIGDHLQLYKRQRQFLFRCVATEDDAAAVRARTLAFAEVRGRTLLVDGYNVLITLETAVRGGPIVRGDDGFSRDLSETHGSYRESATTDRAVALLRAVLAELAPAAVEVYLDRPVSFSARLAERLRKELEVEVILEDSADGALKRRLAELPGAVMASADSVILREATACVDLVGTVVARSLPSTWVLSLVR